MCVTMWKKAWEGKLIAKPKTKHRFSVSRLTPTIGKAGVWISSELKGLCPPCG